jgi:hypothetical protein
MTFRVRTIEPKISSFEHLKLRSKIGLSFLVWTIPHNYVCIDAGLLSTDVTVQKRQYRIGTVTRVSTQCRAHNFIDYLYTSLFTPVLAVACPVKVRLLHCVRIQMG